jgi:glycerol-3-phosphate dehydrogenase (NAD(P)+)
MNVTVVGAGAWGTALALLIHQNGHAVTLWGHDAGHLAELASTGVNERHLPGIPLPRDWRTESDLTHATADAEVLILAVPSRAFRELASRLSHWTGPVVSVTKGIELHTGLTMCGILEQVMPSAIPTALSGPSLALEVARGIPTAVVLAAADPTVARRVQELFFRPAFRVYTSTDLIGVELGGALKNVMAIAAGVCDGLAFGDNAKAALITRGQAEIRRLGVACGARPETFSGLSGLGDLTVTCFSRLSRNRNLGERLGRGEALSDILASTRSAIEGYHTARSARELAERLGVAAPLTREVHAMLYEGKDVRRAVQDLLSRDSKAED